MGIIKQKEKGLLIVISGPSGAGKDSVINKLINRDDINAWVSISMTSRKIRGSEVDGNEYFFVTKEEFEGHIKNGDLLEYAIYNENYYGTPKNKIDEYLDKGIDVILEIDIQGALQIKNLIPEALFIFIMPPTLNEMVSRLVKRGTDSPERIVKRFKIAYEEINEVTKYNYVVVNDILDKAVEKVASIMKAEKCRVDRIEEVFLNNQEEALHEALLEHKIFDNNK